MIDITSECSYEEFLERDEKYIKAIFNMIESEKSNNICCYKIISFSDQFFFVWINLNYTNVRTLMIKNNYFISSFSSLHSTEYLIEWS